MQTLERFPAPPAHRALSSFLLHGDDMTIDEKTNAVHRQGTSLSSRWRDLADMASASDVGDPSPLKTADISGPLTPLPVPQRPFGARLQGLAAAYRRAGLGFWAQHQPPAEVSLWDLHHDALETCCQPCRTAPAALA